MNAYRKGTRVKMTYDALENYGEQYRDVVFRVLFVSRSENDHPGYDMGVYPEPLYDLEAPDGSHFTNSLYHYELEKIKEKE